MATCSVRVFSVLALTSFLFLVSGAPHRVRRQAFVQLVSNESLPCTTLSAEHGSPIIDLTNEEKLELLHNNGGEYMPSYMATSLEEALTNFPSLIPLESRFKEQIKQSGTNPGTNSSPLNKRDIVNYMMNHVYNGFDDDKTRKHGQTNPDTHHKPATDRRLGGPGSHSRSFREMLDDLRDETDIQERRRRWRSWESPEGNNRNFPLMFPEMLGIPRQVLHEDDTVSMNDNCLARGDDTADGLHVRLCTVCSSIRDFGINVWPQFVNEASCQAADNGCLFTDEVSNGSCQQVTMSLKLLAKNNDYCVLVLKDGQTVVAYDWVTIYQDIGVGCECNVKDNSYFTNFV